MNITDLPHRWPGGLAFTATHALVYAQLIVPSGPAGIHPFLLQVHTWHVIAAHHNPSSATRTRTHCERASRRGRLGRRWAVCQSAIHTTSTQRRQQHRQRVHAPDTRARAARAPLAQDRHSPSQRHIPAPGQVMTSSHVGWLTTWQGGPPRRVRVDGLHSRHAGPDRRLPARPRRHHRNQARQL